MAGDSVFFHTAINGLINAAHHQADIVVAIMDNETVALTGFQKRTGAGTTAMGEQVQTIYPEKVAEAMGIENVHTLDAFDAAAIRQTLQETVFNSQRDCRFWWCVDDVRLLKPGSA